MAWRVALIDSCGEWPGAVGAAAFASAKGRVEHSATVADPSGHGSRIAQLITGGDALCELIVAQVFLRAAPTSAAAVAAAVYWSVTNGAELIHMSVGLAADRTVLATAVANAAAAGCIIVASMPARGNPVYPAGYPDVVRATGDARCAPDEVSWLGPWHFGGCASAEMGPITAAGASVGAAWVTRKILIGAKLRGGGEVVEALEAIARYRGPERRAALVAT
jgi:hypothetical protein